MKTGLLSKALFEPDQIKARAGLEADGIEVLLVGRELDGDLFRYLRDHFEVFTIEVGDRLEAGTPVDALSPDAQVRDRSRARIESALEAAEAYGAEAVTIHLMAGASMLGPIDPSPELDREAALEGMKEYLAGLGPKVMVENVLPLDFVGLRRVAVSPVGRMMDDFCELGAPMVLDTAHLGASLIAHTNSRPDIRLYWGPVERTVSLRALGVDLTSAALFEVERMDDGRLVHVHVGNCVGYDEGCDGHVEGALDLDRFLGEVLKRGPRYLIPEIIEEDYVDYGRNRAMLDRLQSMIGNE